MLQIMQPKRICNQGVDDIILKKCTEADVDILCSLLAKTFSETFAHMNTPENMELYLSQAFAREQGLAAV